MLWLHSLTVHPSDVALEAGVHDLVRGRGQQWRIVSQAASSGQAAQPSRDTLVRLRMDERGLWLQLVNQAARVHLNGRPVCRLAHLRTGDVLHVDGIELGISGRTQQAATPSAHGTVVLRAHGGRWHGRSFAVQPRLDIGRADGGGLQLSTRLNRGCLARIARHGGQIRLEVESGVSGVLLNGEPCEQAELMTGDQIAIGNELRLVLESCEQAVQPVVKPSAEIDADVSRHEAQPVVRPTSTLPWLLLAAIGSAAALGGLLLFGAR